MVTANCGLKMFCGGDAGEAQGLAGMNHCLGDPTINLCCVDSYSRPYSSYLAICKFTVVSREN